MHKAMLYASTILGFTLLASGISARAEAPHLAPTAAALPAVPTVPESPFGGRSENVPAALKAMQATGVKLTYLGDRGGMKGYLAEAQDHKMQVFYVVPDGNSLIAGVMFDATGLNVTGVQIAEMQRRYDEAKRTFEARRREFDEAQRRMAEQGTQFDQAREQLGSAPTATSPQQAPVPISPTSIAPAPVPTPTPALAPRADAAPLTAPGGTATQPIPASMQQFVSAMSKDKFLQLVENVPWFTVGDDVNQPYIYMISDPQCPYCHAAWAKLRPLIDAKKIAVRVILIAGLPGSQPLAVSLLARPKTVGQAFYRGEGSVSGKTIAAPPPTDSEEYKSGQLLLAQNMGFAQQVNLTGTPWMGYVGRDGKFYSAQGPDLDLFMKGM